MELTHIIKKLESDYGWSFYDENKTLHITDMQKELILDVARVVEQKLLQHGVMQASDSASADGATVASEGQGEANKSADYEKGYADGWEDAQRIGVAEAHKYQGG